MMCLCRSVAQHCRASQSHWHEIRAAGMYFTKSNLSGIAQLQPVVVDLSWSSISDQQVCCAFILLLFVIDVQLRWFLVNCKRLQSLNLTGCHNLQDMAVTFKYIMVPPK
jgi:hypothetical protein